MLTLHPFVAALEPAEPEEIQVRVGECDLAAIPAALIEETAPEQSQAIVAAIHAWVNGDGRLGCSHGRASSSRSPGATLEQIRRTQPGLESKARERAASRPCGSATGSWLNSDFTEALTTATRFNARTTSAATPHSANTTPAAESSCRPKEEEAAVPSLHNITATPPSTSATNHL